MTESLIDIQHVTKEFTVKDRGSKKRILRAVDDVSLEIRRGETLGVVGESGSGKSTLGRAILQLDRPTSGAVFFEGIDLTTLSRVQRRPFQRRMQTIYQDPYSSLNPYRTAVQQVEEPLRVLTQVPDVREAALAALELVGISGDVADRFPRAFSGGQRQRIAIARAVSVRPDFIVCDEPVSALDVSIQAQVTELLLDLQRQLGLTYLFISHDLAVVRDIATRTAVMFRGRVVELAQTEQLFADPLHPYTRRLLSAVFPADPVRAKEKLAQISLSAQTEPIHSDGELVEVSPGHFVRR